MEKSIESHLVLRKTILSLGGGNFVKTSEKEVLYSMVFVVSVIHAQDR